MRADHENRKENIFSLTDNLYYLNLENFWEKINNMQFTSYGFVFFFFFLTY